MYFQVQINKNKWKLGNNSKKCDLYYNMIDNVILNTIALGQKKENAYKNMIQHLSNNNRLPKYIKNCPIREKKSKKEIGYQILHQLLC